MVFWTPIAIASSLFFPYITGKNFFFRVLTEIIFGFWLALAIVDPKYRPRKGPLLWAVLAFIAVLTLATILGADPYQSFWSNFERMEGLITYLHMVAFFLIASSVLRSKSDWKTLFHISVGASLAMSVYGLFEQLGMIQVPGASPGRVFARLGNPIYLAAYLLFHFFILGILAFWVKNIWARTAYVLILLFELYIFLSTGTRGAVVGLAAGLGAMLLVLVLFSKDKRIRIAGGALVLAGIMAAILLVQFKEISFVRSNTFLSRIADTSVTSSTAQSRLMIWNMGWQAFKERPVLGWGPGNFIIPYAKYYNQNLYGNEPWFDRVHNMHLEWLVAAGIPGFLAYVGLFAVSGFLLWKLQRKQVLSLFEAAVIVGFFVTYLVQNTFVFDNVITYLFVFLMLAFLHGLYSWAIVSGVAPNIQSRKVAVNQNMFLACLCVILGIGLAFWLNAKQIQSARGIIQMLNTAGTGKGVMPVIQKFDETLKLGTFGVSEARERYVDMVIQVSFNKDKIPAQDFILLVSKGIAEMEKEAAKHPDSIKATLPLGKLYQLRFAATQSEADKQKSIEIYEHALKMAPHYPALYLGLAETHLVGGDAAKAADTVDKIFRTITRPNSLIYSTLTVSVLADDFDLAVDQLSYFLSLGNSDIYPQPIYLEPEKIEEVVQRSFVSKDAAGRELFLKKILEVTESTQSPLVVVYAALAETEVELGKNSEARKYAERALEFSPEEYKEELRLFIKNLPS